MRGVLCRKDLFSSMLPKYAQLLQEDLKVLVYSGDVVRCCDVSSSGLERQAMLPRVLLLQDGIVPVTGTRRWIRQLGLEIEKPWRAWRSSTGKCAAL